MSSPDVENSDVDTTPEDAPQKLNLDIKVEAPSSCQRHVTVTISQEDVQRYFEKAIEEMLPTVNVPGFRKGNAPKKLVEKRFRSEVKDQVKGSLLMDSMTQASDDQDFSAISEPDFDFSAIEIEDAAPLTFEFNIEVRPEFDLPQWKGLNLEKPSKSFEKADIDEHLLKVLDRYAQIAPHEGAAEMGDHLVVNAVFKHDGKEIDRLDEESIRLKDKLSFQDANWDDFGKEMTGAKAGDTKTVSLTVTDEADNENLRGKQVEMELEILEIKRTELPEMTPEFLKKIGGFESEGDLRDFVKQDMERQLTYYSQRRLREQITETLTKTADWDLPPELLKRQAKRELDRAVLELRSAGFEDDQIRAYENQLRQNSLQSTRKALTEHFILERIAEDQAVEDLPEDYDQEIMALANQRAESPRGVRARLEKQGMMDALRNQIIERKVIDLITSEANFTETPADLQQTNVAGVDFAISGEAQSLPVSTEEAASADEGDKE
ncbi:MAG: trigger factor [Pirellulaceae bacterium]